MDQTLRPLLIPPEFALYAEKHSIFTLYQHLLSQIIIHKPDDPIQYIIDFLKADVNSNRIIVLGPSSSGKKSLSRMLAKKTGSVLLTQNNLLESMPNQYRQKISKELQNKKLSAENWATLLKMRIEEYDCVRKGWILENFPETREQALALLTAGVLPKHTIILNGANSMLIERAAGKRVDPKTGEIYHTTFDWPFDQSVQQRLEIPSNNTEQDLMRRLIEYNRHIGGLVDTFRATAKHINVDQPKGDVFNQMLEFVSREARSNMPITPRIVLIGPYGSGRRTQAQALCKKYDLVNVSMSSLIREAIATESPLGIAIAPHLTKHSVPDSLLVPLLKERLSKLDCVTRGWVLYGYPRTHDQAASLDEFGCTPNRVFFMDVPNDSIIERTTLRYLDPVSGERYHMLFNPPPMQEIRDRLTQKHTDTEQYVRVKLNQYYARIRDLLDYYDDESSLSSKAVHINADQDPNTVFESIESNIVNSLPKYDLVQAKQFE